mmetsp:Transcript_89320/g.286214  ORF Transcript_89320/g.286214 Transcript_89320/m.286214 type:complete len:258 (+) Transcript_89320:179-952(+)
MRGTKTACYPSHSTSTLCAAPDRLHGLANLKRLHLQNHLCRCLAIPILLQHQLLGLVPGHQQCTHCHLIPKRGVRGRVEKLLDDLFPACTNGPRQSCAPLAIFHVPLRTRGEQQRNDCRVAFGRSRVQGCGTGARGRIHVCIAVQQQTDERVLALARARVESRPTFIVSNVHICTRSDQELGNLCMACSASTVQGATAVFITLSEALGHLLWRDGLYRVEVARCRVNEQRLEFCGHADHLNVCRPSTSLAEPSRQGG